MEKEQFDQTFENFLIEISFLIKQDKNQNFDYKDIIRYFKKSKERFYQTLNFLPDNAFQKKSCLEIGVGFFTVFMNSKNIKSTGTGKNLHFWKMWAKKKSVEIKEVDLTLGLPFSNSSFEVIYFCEVMEHLLGFPEDYLSELYRVLKPGGYLIITTPNLLRVSNRIRFIFGKNFLDPFENTYDGVNHLREFDKGELEIYLKKAGFIISNSKTFNYYHTFKDLLVYGALNHPSLRRMIFTLCTK